MSSTTSNPAAIPQTDLDSFHAHLLSSTRILALLGAGLSASSGLPTFRGAGGLWRTHDAMALATPEAFSADPSLVWHFYSARRHAALHARPNAAHFALAQLALRRPGFMTLSQNVDGLSQRAGHAGHQLQLLHGSLFEVKCTNFYCRHVAPDFADPIVPALAVPDDGHDLTAEDADLPSVPVHDLPTCPTCAKGLLRPGVVWFGEQLPNKVIDAVDRFIVDAPRIDLMLVIGTSARVYPAAGYVDRAMAKGARVAVINMDRNDAPAQGLGKDDWFFHGDAAVVVPRLLEPVVGRVEGLADEGGAEQTG